MGVPAAFSAAAMASKLAKRSPAGSGLVMVVVLLGVGVE
jgi:hypothetical protein